ncbi:MAG: EAL domain-containing protein [Desulfobulbaceae bacterium]|nr:EAL domain-containing protein [Desulfobulbaceae bacterium]HIJ78633.1 EAL domain-containing protein [Deltaproteobacteria bacterium]
MRDKILLVDDHPENLVSLEAVLESLDVEMVKALSGKDALTLAFKEDFCLVLLDVQMPEMDGFEVAHFLKQAKRTREIPIIFITAISKEDKHVFKGYSTGAVDYVFKPFNPKTLLAKVNVFLQLQRQKKELAGKTVELQGMVADLEQTRRELEKSKLYLLNAQKIAKLGIWSWGLHSEIFSCSTELCNIVQLEKGKRLQGMDDFIGMVAVADRQTVKEKIDQAIYANKSYSIEHRIDLPGSAQRVVFHSGEIFYDEKNEPEVLIGTVHDITDLRMVEGQLKLTEEVLNSAGEGVLITDSDSVIITVNPAFTLITGYTAEEVVGKKPNVLKSKHHDEVFYKALWGALLSEGKWHGEIWNRRKSGEAYPQLTSITAVKKFDGTVSNYIGVLMDISAEKNTEEELRYQADHDALTSLPNRALFVDRLGQAIPGKGSGRKVAVYTLGLDHFKKINDSLGPNVGDALLLEVAQRSADYLAEANSFSRLGGDEFAFFVKDVGTVQQVAQLADHFFEIFDLPFSFGDHVLYVTASMGISLAPDDAMDSATLFKNAGLAMHRAKERGRNQYQFFTQAMDEEAAKRLQLEGEMRKGIAEDEFFLVYQPKVDLSTGRVVGMEALVRWRHKESGIVSPADFIPVAEDTGLVIPLGKWILEEACRATRNWLESGYDLKVSVNLSVKQFQSPELVEMIEKALLDNDFPAARLELEITESMVMGDMVLVIEKLRRLKALGLEVSMDDFGTGYSSLSYLKKLPIDTLKIDQSFIRDLESDSEDAHIVSAIIAMAKSLNLKVIAEGVEQQEHVEFLRGQNCDMIQGYFFSKPLPADEFSALLKDGRGL